MCGIPKVLSFLITLGENRVTFHFPEHSVNQQLNQKELQGTKRQGTEFMYKNAGTWYLDDQILFILILLKVKMSFDYLIFKSWAD